MKKIILSALFAALSIGPALAKDVYRSEDGDVAVRGAACVFAAHLDGSWQTAPGSCTMYKDATTNNTLVWIGKGRMLIRRDPEEKGFAKLYRVDPATDEPRLMGNVVASRNCWVGKTVRFCAK